MSCQRLHIGPSVERSLEMFSNSLSNSKASLINLDSQAQQTETLVTEDEWRGTLYCCKANGIFVKGKVGGEIGDAHEF